MLRKCSVLVPPIQSFNVHSSPCKLTNFLRFNHGFGCEIHKHPQLTVNGCCRWLNSVIYLLLGSAFEFPLKQFIIFTLLEYKYSLISQELLAFTFLEIFLTQLFAGIYNDNGGRTFLCKTLRISLSINRRRH